MLIHVAEILKKKPELSKLASLSDDWDSYPCTNQAETMFSAIYAGYLEKTAQIFEVPPFVKRAIKVHGIDQESVDKMVSQLTAENLPKEVQRNNEELAKAAEYVMMEKTSAEIIDFAEYYNYSFNNPYLAMRAGQVPIQKAAALEALEAREAAISSPLLDVMREALEKSASVLKGKDAAKIVQAFDSLDSKVGYSTMGFNFCKEADLFQRRSTLLVNLAGKQIPIESILAVGKAKIEDILGEKLPSEDPQELKAILETLPRDLAELLLRYVK